MSKRDMPWPEIGARVEVAWRDPCELGGWTGWTFHGAARGWLCLMPAVEYGEAHDGEGRLHWFPASAVDCMVEVGDE